MKKLLGLGLIGLLSLGLTGCATAGRAYDDSKVVLIKKDMTTESDLVEWFGPPAVRTMNENGTKTMAWKFASAKMGPSHSAGHLDVRLGADGKVVAYSASTGR